MNRLDYKPVFCGFVKEPSLRELILRYYAGWNTADLANYFTDEYIKQLENNCC